MNCGCKTKESNEQYGIVFAIAEKHALKLGACYVLFRLACGNYDFELMSKFNPDGKTEIEYIIPVL